MGGPKSGRPFLDVATKQLADENGEDGAGEERSQIPTPRWMSEVRAYFDDL